MLWIQLVTLLALVQFLFFGVLAGRARGIYKIPAPAMTGHETFERYVRVHMNTLETMVVFLPALWLAAQYWPPAWIAAIGAVYLIGRVIYLRGYVAHPGKRGAGYGLSILPTMVLVLAALIGVLRAMLAVDIAR